MSLILLLIIVIIYSLFGSTTENNLIAYGLLVTMLLDFALFSLVVLNLSKFLKWFKYEKL